MKLINLALKFGEFLKAIPIIFIRGVELDRAPKVSQDNRIKKATLMEEN